MKRLLTIIGAVGVVIGVDAAVSSRSYVQRGLAAQYDGINNVSHDAAHNSSTKVWKDLTGNGNDGNCESSSKFSWVGGDGWSVSGDCKPVAVPEPGLAATLGTCAFTIQFACTPAMDNKREAFFSQYYNYGGFGLEHNTGGDFTGKLRYYGDVSRTGLGGVNYLTSATISAGTFTSASVAVSPDVQKCYLNGTLADTRNGVVTMISRSCPSVIGGEVQASGRTGSAYTDGYGIAFQGKYNAFRLYDRPLSEDEAKVNAAVDAIRFDGANPSDFALTGGWSFDGAGDLCVDVAATVSGNGTVSVNGGGASATVKQYATVALAATPASGSVFCRWEGDTQAIVSGSAITPEIEVSAADPVALVAVFKVPAGLNAYSYIRKGLVANFDGIDNTGTGVHDSSATTWADLTGNGNDADKGSNAAWNGTDGWTSGADGKPMVVPEGDGAATTFAGTIATKVFTLQFAAKPSRHTVRQCFFGQYAKYGVSIEHNGGNSTMDGHLRAYYHYVPGVGDADDLFTQVLVASDEWVSMSFLNDTARQTFWKNGQTSQTIVKALAGTLTNRCTAVIGGDNSRDNMGFRGTYNALRLYNRVLTEEEIKVNAAIDDRRFNGGAKGLALPSGWSFVDDALMVAVSATATEGGKVSYRGGAAARSIADTVNHDGSKVLAFAAVPDAGYVFERWSGRTDLIVTGSTITREITVDPEYPVTLVAKFRRCGDAMDGKVYDLSFTGDATADGITFSDTVAEEKQGYVTADIALPVLPTVTNANVSCLYLPQPNSGTGTYWQMAVSDKPAVTGDVATVFVRFRWDGPVIANLVNYPAVFHNGYNGWTSIGQGFMIRLYSKANSTDAYLSLLMGGCDLGGEKAVIEDVAGTGFIKSGEWVDVFASVYPSPTNPTLSNADIWYCRAPAWVSNGSCFAASTIGHRHFGDAAAIPRMNSTTTLLRTGCESAPSASAVVTGNNATKVFRGAIAAAKGWNRLLSEGEMWTVMAGFDGVQSFGGKSRTFNTGALTTQEGRNGTSTAFIGDTDTEHFWRAMSKNYPPLTLIWNAPKDKPAQPVVYKTAIPNFKAGNAQPLHLEVNGTTVWSSDNVARGDKISVEIDAAYTRPGLNELKWVYDVGISGNWVTFECHKLRMGVPGMVINFK